jgi:hypothetical protein
MRARHEVFHWQLQALVPGLTAGQLKIIKQKEREARMERRRICELIRQDIRARYSAQLRLPLPSPRQPQ